MSNRILRVVVQVALALIAIHFLLEQFARSASYGRAIAAPTSIVDSPVEEPRWFSSDGLADAGSSRTSQSLETLSPQDIADQKQEVSLSTSPVYEAHSFTSPENSIKHHVFQRRDADMAAGVLFLTLTRNADSWGRNPTQSQRDVNDYLDLIANTTLDPSRLSVGLLTSSSSVFEDWKLLFASITTTYPFARITLILHPGYERGQPLTSATSHSASESDVDAEQDTNFRQSRHTDSMQHERRANLAKLRNYLMLTSLQRETHVIWLDADVYRFSSPDLVETMVDMTTETYRSPSTSSTEHEIRDIGLLTVRCQIGEPERLADLPPPPSDDTDTQLESPNAPNETHDWKVRTGNYDLNAWTGPRSKPDNEHLSALHHGDFSTWIPQHARGAKSLTDLYRSQHALLSEQQEPHPSFLSSNTDETHRIAQHDRAQREVFPLDAVGGTVLVIRTDLLRMGLVFTPGYIAGASFEYGEGYDGIETEGLCLMSRFLSKDGGSMCYGLLGDWAVWHTVY